MSRPTEPGFYWLRWNAAWRIVEVYETEVQGRPPHLEVAFHGTEITDPLDEVEGEWGPKIEPPGGGRADAGGTAVDAVREWQMPGVPHKNLPCPEAATRR